MGMIPGMGKAMKDVDIKDDAFKHIEAIITSMTPKERANPVIINGQRKNRIAAGSGTNIQEVNKLLKQFEDTKKMMKIMSNPKNMMSMMKQMHMAHCQGGMPSTSMKKGMKPGDDMPMKSMMQGDMRMMDMMMQMLDQQSSMMKIPKVQ